MARPIRHTEIAGELRGRILSGQLKSGQALPHREKLAAEFRAGTATIQKGIDQLIREGLVEATKRKGTFVCPPRSALQTYGLVLPEPNPHASRLSLFYTALDAAAAATHKARLARFRTYRGLWYHGADREYERLWKNVREGRLAGLVLAHTYMPLTIRGEAPWRAHGLPVAAIDFEEYDDALVRTLVPDMQSFLRNALVALAAKGCSRVAVLSTVMLGNLALEARFAEAGLSHDPALCQALQVDGARACVELLMGQSPARRPDGLIVADDHLVEGATSALRALGTRLARDMPVVAYLNAPRPPKTRRPVCWLGFDADDILGTCVELIAEMRRGENVPSLTKLPARFLSATKGRS